MILDFPVGSVLKNLPASAGAAGDVDEIPGQEDLWRKWQPTWHWGYGSIVIVQVVFFQGVHNIIGDIMYMKH